MGAAGRARLEALREHPQIQLAGILSRRPHLATRSPAEVLADPLIPALAISLENTAHEAAVRQALAAGKHVLVDYPLALTQRAGEALFALAREKDKVLHVEHIGLLTGEHRRLKKEVEEKGPLEKGEYFFQAGFNEKIADPKRTGPLPLLALPRLLQVADLWGMPRLEKFRYETDRTGFSLHLHLQFPEGGNLGFTEERRKGLARRRTLTAQCRGGVIRLKAGVSGGGLFAKDLDHFIRRIRGQAGAYYNETMMVQLIGSLEKIK